MVLLYHKIKYTYKLEIISRRVSWVAKATQGVSPPSGAEVVVGTLIYIILGHQSNLGFHNLENTYITNLGLLYLFAQLPQQLCVSSNVIGYSSLPM